MMVVMMVQQSGEKVCEVSGKKCVEFGEKERDGYDCMDS